MDVWMKTGNAHVIPAKFHLALLYYPLSERFPRKEVFALNFYSKSLSL